MHHEAIACEAAARHFGALGLAPVERTYLRQARRCYAAWGADAKVAQLDTRYPALADAKAASTSSTSPASVDALALARASQAISEHVEPSELVEALLQVSMQHALADYGVLLLAQGGSLYLAASGEAHGGRRSEKYGSARCGLAGSSASSISTISPL